MVAIEKFKFCLLRDYTYNFDNKFTTDNTLIDVQKRLLALENKIMEPRFIYKGEEYEYSKMTLGEFLSDPNKPIKFQETTKSDPGHNIIRLSL
jgi:hypothetical protein